MFRQLATFCGSLLLDNGILFNRKEKVHFDFAENNVKRGAFIYRNGPEWTELPECTTGMDFYMWLLVLFMHFI